jgi:2-dehydropantoate 2-reductase
MKITIVGPGAMGCLFAGLLVESGQNDVWLVDKNQSRADELVKDGLTIEGIGGTRTITGIQVTSSPDEIGYADLILICVKSYDTLSATNSIARIVGNNTVILTLQNGLTNVEIISSILGEDKILAGVTSHGATMLDIGYIRHAGVGDTVIGKPVKSETVTDKKVEYIAEILKSAGFLPKISCNIWSFIWGKLIINSAINPITAITKLTNGELPEHEETKRLLRMTVQESARVAYASHVSLPYDDPVSAVEFVCRSTALNVSSMLQDILKMKQTEIDAINGAIIDKGRDVGIETPINQALTYLVKSIESRRIFSK